MTKQQSKRGGVTEVKNPIKPQKVWMTEPVDYKTLYMGTYYPKKPKHPYYKYYPVLITPIIKKARAKAQIKTRK